MTYTEDIHKKIMKIHDPKGNQSGFLMAMGALTVLLSIFLLLLAWGNPLDGAPLSALQKIVKPSYMFSAITLGALAIVTGNSYRNICTILFGKGIIIREFDPEIRKHILSGKKSRNGEILSYRRTRLKGSLDEFTEECEELAPEYRKEALYLRMKKWVEIEVPEIISRNRKFRKKKFEEFKARHGFLELELEKEKN